MQSMPSSFILLVSPDASVILIYFINLKNYIFTFLKLGYISQLIGNYRHIWPDSCCNVYHCRDMCRLDRCFYQHDWMTLFSWGSAMNYLRTIGVEDVSSDIVVWKFSIEPSDRSKNHQQQNYKMGGSVSEEHHGE